MKLPGATKIPSAFKDRRVQIGLAAAAALGLVVLVRKGTDAPRATTDGSPVQAANYDGGGYDNYAALSQLLGGYSDQLSDILDQLGAVNGPTGATPAPVVPKPAAHPVTSPTKLTPAAPTRTPAR